MAIFKEGNTVVVFILSINNSSIFLSYCWSADSAAASE